MQYRFHPCCYILTLKIIYFHLFLESFSSILLAATNDLKTFILVISLLHICYTDIANQEIDYLDLAIFAILLFLKKPINFSYLKLIYLAILLIGVIKSRLGFGDFILILCVALRYSDFILIIFMLNACLSAFLNLLITHQEQIPFGPHLVISYLIIHLF